MTATVASVDLKSRTLALHGPGGHLETLHVDDAVPSLGLVRKGDRVRVSYHRAAELTVRKVKPGARAEKTPRGRSLVARIAALNPKEGTVTIEQPGGRSMTLEVDDFSHFEGLRMGDPVAMTYTEARAVSVERVRPTGK
jgi:hypothetical protein